MLTLTGDGQVQTCQGVTRRDFLQVGTLGGKPESSVKKLIQRKHPRIPETIFMGEPIGRGGGQEGVGRSGCIGQSASFRCGRLSPEFSMSAKHEKSPLKLHDGTPVQNPDSIDAW